MGIMHRALRDRQYLMWVGLLLFVFGTALLLVVGEDDAKATQVPAPVPTATAIPAPTAVALTLEQVFLDARRQLDLATVADALEAYRAQHGGYPTTENYLTTLCTSGFDPGCLLLSVEKQLPGSDGFDPYWYQSDGTAYVIFTRIEQADDAHGCPAELPDALRDGDVYCLQHDGGTTP